MPSTECTCNHNGQKKALMGAPLCILRQQKIPNWLSQLLVEEARRARLELLLLLRDPCLLRYLHMNNHIIYGSLNTEGRYKVFTKNTHRIARNNSLEILASVMTEETACANFHQQLYLCILHECIQVCEQVVDAMKSSDPLPPSLLAKMIKYKVLREKAAHRSAIAQKVCTQ